MLLTDKYNAAFGDAAIDRLTLLKELPGRVGDGAHFGPTFRCEFGQNIIIGDGFYANFDCVMLDGGGIEIGDNVLLAPSVGISCVRCR